MIYTVTLNPALDCYMQGDVFAHGQTNRAKSQTLAFGGKGVNVAVMLARLGIPCVATGFVAGFVGEALCGYLVSEGVTEDMIRLPEGNTRINVKLTEDMTNTETEINAQGPQIQPSALQALYEKFDGLGQGDILVLSGNVPACLPVDTYARIMQKLQGRGVLVVVDAEGETLKCTLPYHPFLVKPNLGELEGVVGENLGDTHEIAPVKRAAEVLQGMGACHVLVSMGKQGAVLLTKDGDAHVSPALGGAAVNTVGAGDAMLAGFLAGLPQGEAYAFQMGLAAGGATAMTWGLATATAVFDLLS